MMVIQKIKHSLMSLFNRKDNQNHLQQINQRMKHFVKILLIGTSEKRNIQFRNEIGQTFSQNIVEKLGTDFSVRKITLENEDMIGQIWEISPLKKFQKIRNYFMLGAKGVIILVDPSNLGDLDDPIFMVNDMVKKHHMIDPKIIDEIPILLIAYPPSDKAKSPEEVQNYVKKHLTSTKPKISFMSPNSLTDVEIANFVNEFILTLQDKR